MSFATARKPTFDHRPLTIAGSLASEFAIAGQGDTCPGPILDRLHLRGPVYPIMAPRTWTLPMQSNPCRSPKQTSRTADPTEVPMHRRLASQLAALLLAVLAAAPMTGGASAQSFPPKSLRIIVPWPPGGLSDIVCRHLQQPLSDVLGVPVVIENKSGASGLIGTEAIARSPGDGTVIGTVGSSHAANTALFAKLPYDAVADFKPITILARSPNVIGVHPSASYKSLADILAAAKSAPGSLHYVTSGNGTAQHLGFEQLKIDTGVSMEHVPYRGAGPALNDLSGGQVKLGFLNIAGMLPLIKAGSIRAIAVSSPKRSALLPDIPSIAESIPGFDFVEYAALVAPAGVPDEVIEKLYQAIAKAARSQAYETGITKVGMELSLESPAEYRALLARDIPRIGDLVRKANIKIE